MQVGTKGSVSNKRRKNSWMGYGIHVSKEPEILSIDILPYLLWSNTHSSENGSQHAVVIADDLAAYNGVDLTSARKVGRKKKEDLQKVIESHDLDIIDILSWEDVSKEPGYQTLLEELKSLVLEDYRLRRRLREAVPQRYRTAGRDTESILNELGYVLEEVAVTLYLNETGWPIKIGHNLERPYDSKTLMIHNNREYRDRLGINSGQPMMIYLKGGHTLHARNESDIVPPYMVKDPSRRITYTDTPGEVVQKLRGSSEYYRAWCKEILEMGTGQRPSSDDVKILGHSLYERLIEPAGIGESNGHKSDSKHAAIYR